METQKSSRSEIKIQCDYSELVPTKSLLPHPKNPNKHPKEQIERLAQIIKYQGMRHPIVVSRLSHKIVAGHGRVEALRLLGVENAPVDFQEFESPEQEMAFLISDNAIQSEWAELDLSIIESEAKELVGKLDLDLLGMKDLSFDDPEKKEIEDDIPEVDEKNVRTKLGDIYELGDHRLMCGDSTDRVTVDKLMNGEKADMVFTDPPYGMNLDTDYSKMPISPTGAKPKKYNNIKGDHEDFRPELIRTIFNSFDYCSEVFVCGADYFAELLPKKNEGSWLVWDKRVTENFDRMIGSAFELIWSRKRRKREIARINNTLYSGESDAVNKVHPTQKPIKLLEWVFERTEGSSVADLFGGSGSTLIACEKTKRKCFMMELDPHYCDVIVSRWFKYTGKNELKLNGKKIKWEMLNAT